MRRAWGGASTGPTTFGLSTADSPHHARRSLPESPTFGVVDGGHATTLTSCTNHATVLRPGGTAPHVQSTFGRPARHVLARSWRASRSHPLLGSSTGTRRHGPNFPGTDRLIGQSASRLASHPLAGKHDVRLHNGCTPSGHSQLHQAVTHLRPYPHAEWGVSCPSPRWMQPRAEPSQIPPVGICG